VARTGMLSRIQHTLRHRALKMPAAGQGVPCQSSATDAPRATGGNWDPENDACSANKLGPAEAASTHHVDPVYDHLDVGARGRGAHRAQNSCSLGKVEPISDYDFTTSGTKLSWR
jgi:hypothetical protein